MKKIVPFFIAFILFKTTNAQFESRYDFGNTPPILQECNSIGDKIGGKFAAPAGASFKITNMLNSDTAIASCLLFGELNKAESMLKLNSELNSINYFTYNCRSINEKALVDKDTNELEYQKEIKEYQEKKIVPLKIAEKYRRYFFIRIADLAKFSTPFFQTWHKNRSFVVGAQAKLLKIRIKEFDFADDVSISTNFGVRYRTNAKKDNFLNIVASIGISLNKLDSSVAPKIPINSPVSSIGALSLGLGIIKEYGKVQISFMLGKDYLSKYNQNKYDWKYNGKTWISFGVGLGIFNGDDGKKSSITETTSTK